MNADNKRLVPLPQSLPPDPLFSLSPISFQAIQRAAEDSRISDGATNWITRGVYASEYAAGGHTERDVNNRRALGGRQEMNAKIKGFDVNMDIKKKGIELEDCSHVEQGFAEMRIGCGKEPSVELASTQEWA